MSATAPTPTAPTIDVASTPAIPFGRLVGVELRKSYDTRAGFWLLATIAILVLLAESVATIVGITVDDANFDLGTFVRTASFLTSILLPVLGILLVTGEWGQRTAMVTFALEPRRSQVIAAKYVVGLVLTIITALVAVVIGVVCNAILGLASGGADWTFGWPVFIGFLVVQCIAMTTGFALAALLLNTPAAIVVFFAFTFMVPTIFGFASAFLDWFDRFSQWIDFQRAQGPVSNLTLDSGAEWGHLIVSGALWLGIPLVFGLRRILSAEVK